MLTRRGWNRLTMGLGYRASISRRLSEVLFLGKRRNIPTSRLEQQKRPGRRRRNPQKSRRRNLMPGLRFSMLRSARTRVNPLPHAEGDGLPMAILQMHSIFQSTPPRGGRRGLTGGFEMQEVFQSTPSHGGRRSRRSNIYN